MGRYKRYLFLNQNILRCTQWYRRKRQNEEEKIFLSHSIVQQKSAHISDETLHEEQLPHLNPNEKQEKYVNSNKVCAQVPHIVSTRNSPTEVSTPSSSSTIVIDNISVMLMLQSNCDQGSAPTDWFSIKNFQSFASNVEDQDNDNSDSNTIIFGTENESEYDIEDKSDMEDNFTDNLRNESILENVEPCLVEDENCDTFDDGELMREFSSFEEQETLCPCTKTTVADVMFMCLVLGLRHNLSWEAQIDILKMFNAIYGDNTIKVMKYSYFKLLDREKENISFHIYCPDCEIYLKTKENLKENEICTNCDVNIDVSKPSNFFISISLESQLQKLTKNNDFVHAVMNHRFNRKKIKENALEDIYDGDEYKKHFENGGILSSPYNFSYSFFTDGVRTGKSNNKTLWPIYLTINELPISERNKNVLLSSLYIGPKDPNQKIFLQPFINEANKLSTEEFRWFHNGKEIVSKVIPLCCIADSVARYQLLNFQSFVASYGCTFCYQKSERTRKGQRFTISIHPAEKRTLESTKKDLFKAFQRKDETNESKRHYRGVKSFSPLMILHHFNFVTGFVVDYMHNILLGVTKLHTELILQSTRKNFWHISENIGIGHVLNMIDERLLMIHPPSSITRTPRSIKDISRWKASEWRAWLLFYFVPCLKDLLKKKYINHYTMLSVATNILLKKSVKK